jgi:alkylation response protein AidB-like acyl-CoA dehydrogenase
MSRKLADLGNQFDTDRVLRSYLKRTCPPEMYASIKPDLQALGAETGGELYDLQLQDRPNTPRLVQWDPTGDRIDQIELTDVWQRVLPMVAEHGVIATAYERENGALSRVHQGALAYLTLPASDMMGFLLATTDGSIATLLRSGNEPLIDEVVPHLLSRTPDTFWTSGQWRTEQSGGTDLSKVDTEARYEDGEWRLYGHKWFTSSTAANMAIVLARPESNNDQGRAGLSLFHLPIRGNHDASPAEGIRVNRLKESMGAKKLPVSEVTLDGAVARPITELKNGTRHLTPMVDRARMWNALIAVSSMRRGLALARDYARKRKAFGTPIIEKPLHYDTLADVQATFEGAFHLTFRFVELIGKEENDALSNEEQHLLRALSPLAKLITGRQAVEVSTEVIEAFGGSGYVEETGIPALLRDAFALPLWEGTTNVMSLIALRTLRRDGRLEAVHNEIKRCADAVDTPALQHAMKQAQDAFKAAVQWLADTLEHRGEKALEAGARRFAYTIAHALEAALLIRHAQWAIQDEGRRPIAVAEYFTAKGINHIARRAHYDGYMLAKDFNRQSLFQSEAPVDTGAQKAAL